MHLGERVKQRREAIGWTQTQLAQAIGMSQHRISEVELGKRQQMSFDRLRSLALALGVSADWLLGTWDEIAEAPTEAPTAEEDAAAPPRPAPRRRGGRQRA